MLDVQEGIPLPPKKRRRVRLKYPFESMEVGEFFFVPHKPTNNMAPYVSSVGKRLGKKFYTRHVHMKRTLAGWEPCADDTKGAVLGVGVWRRD